MTEYLDYVATFTGTLYTEEKICRTIREKRPVKVVRFDLYDKEILEHILKL